MEQKYALHLLKETTKYYNHIARHFSMTRSFVWESLKTLAQYISEGEKVLDLGCGNGRLLQLFQNKKIDYIGVDNSEKLIEIAKKKYPKAKFQVADALSLPFPANYFEKIYSIAVFHHIPSQELRLQFLKEAKRVLKKDGFLILTVWNLWHKRTTWKSLFKFAILKLVGKSKLDFGDIFIPWKSPQGEILAQRYLHCFTKRELEKSAKKVDFKIIESGILGGPEMKNNNIYLIAQNP